MILFTYWQFLEIADIEFMIILVNCIVEFFTGLWSIMIVSGIKVGNVFISFRATQKKSSRLQVMLSVSTIKVSIVQYWHLYCCLCRWLKSVLTFLIYMKQLPTDRSVDRSTGPISLINYLISEVIYFDRM